MPVSEVRVRIAPSPSGYLHVGTARTAIFNWLFARHHGGKFIMRIEDTDKERSDSDLVQPILDALKWLGVDWDEGPFFQSQRLESYKPYVERLLVGGHAYRCFCSPQELEQEREKAMAEKRAPRYDRRCLSKSEAEIAELMARNMPCAVRLRIPEGATTYEDMVLGNITRQNDEIEDLVICRGDGRAVYNMAVVVDDYEMGITHVIRGNDHISNTFKQIHIYRSLGIEPPRFAHVPLILRPDKRKVSKRLGDKDVAEYGKEGILPEALFNFLCLLGWSPKDDRELIRREDLVRIFLLKNVTAANPIFNEEKLEALNKEYIKLTPDYKLAEMVAPLLVNAGFTTKYWLETRWNYLIQVVALLKERCRRVTDFVSMSEYFFHSEFKYNSEEVKNQFNPQSQQYLEKLCERFSALENFTKENLETALGTLAEELAVKKGQLIHPTRLAVSGMAVGPGLYDLLVTLGKDEVIKRLKRAVQYIQSFGG
ncbi:MAG: glutamate--tRNA ligase [candidate division Zixibacteria bacterium]|nr:glutamate--tRNA ligase [candidate division Zixibacteria bacterium]